LLAGIIGLAAFAWGCSGEDPAEAIRAQEIARTRTLLSNQCQTDADCVVTGCRGTMCRAMAEEAFCVHRLVIALDEATDLEAVQRIVALKLTAREAETVRAGGYAAGQWTLSFHASASQRRRIETTLEHLAHSGLGRLHPRAEAQSRALFEALSPSDADISLKTMQGAGPLIEKQIRSGDVLTKSDIRDVWQQLATALDGIQFSQEDELERFWAYDILTGRIAFLRLWPMDRRQRISLKHWIDFSHYFENGDWHVRGELSSEMAKMLERWTGDGILVGLLLGNEVIASGLARGVIEDGRFAFILRGVVDNEDLRESLEVLALVAQMKGGVHLVPGATALVERDIACHEKHPRQCACLDGTCGWHLNLEYNACLYENSPGEDSR